MDAVLFIIAAIAASTPMIAAALVSVASRLEDSEWTLGEAKVGPVRMIARRILDFHTDGPEWPRPRSRRRARTPSRLGAPSRTEAPSRDPEPDPGRVPAGAAARQLLVTSR